MAPMNRQKPLLATALLVMSVLACDARSQSVVGRWERIRDHPRGLNEWVQFETGGTFTAAVRADTIRGTYAQQGETVTITGNYTQTLTLRDSILVMNDGTEYRRMNPRP